MSWFKREKPNLGTSEQHDIPQGSWRKCESCGEVLHKKQVHEALYTCPKCSASFRIPSAEYISLLLDPKSFKEYDRKIKATDPLRFQDTKRYSDRVKATIDKTRMYDAIRCGLGNIDGRRVSIAVMDFDFIGGSMGSVVGEKISRAIDRAIKHNCPLITVSASGGARMMEGAFSLMQMAKTAARLTLLADAHLPYISIMLDPTTGGVTASFAMLGDINIGEPGALIGFAGPRVIKQTIGHDLPEGFQRAEFLQEKGFIDVVVPRKEMRNKVSQILKLLVDL
jgi:acetyl-CoA carboxylase carboxyl transferase subunit beta